MILHDSKGHEYRMTGNEIYLKINGPREAVVFIGTVRNKVLFVERFNKAGHWVTKKQCWFLNHFVMKNHDQFDFSLVYLTAFKRDTVRAEWVKVKGFVAPETVLARGEFVQYSGYEVQLGLHPEDLRDDEAKAKDLSWEMAKNPPAKPAPPKKKPAPDHRSAQGSLF